MLVWAMKSFTPAEVLAKPVAAGWLGGLHPPPISSTESRGGYTGTATKMPVCLCRLLEAFYPFANQSIKKKTHFASFVGSAELEFRAAFIRCWCENAEFMRCQSRSEGMLGISVVYTNLHKMKSVWQVRKEDV